MSQSTKTLKEFGAVSVQGGTLEIVIGTGALGGLSTSKTVSDVRTTGASTGTLADGATGQIKTIVMTVDGGDYVLTPANLTGGTTITFADVADCVTLLFANGSWVITANSGAVLA